MIVCEGREIKLHGVVNSVLHFSEINLDTFCFQSSMEKARFSVQAVCIKGEVYIIGGKVQGRSVKNDQLKSIHPPPKLGTKW